MSLLKEKMLDCLPPNRDKLQKLRKANWWYRNCGPYPHIKAFFLLVLLALAILVISWFMSVRGESQDAKDQPSLLYWLW